MPGASLSPPIVSARSGPNVDRRGHGRSTQVGDGHDMDHYADDLAALTAHLDLKNAGAIRRFTPPEPINCACGVKR